MNAMKMYSYSSAFNEMRPTKAWQIVKDLFIDYSQHSSIHGVRYITEKDRSWFERIWWILVVCMSIVGCGKLIYDALILNPIIISFTEKPTSIWQIPFPAVTICPNIFSQSKHFNLNTTLHSILKGELHPKDLTEDQRTQMLAIELFCSKNIVFGDHENRTNCNECLQMLRKIKIPLEELFVECKFQTQVMNCTELFEELVTGFAMCYTFNGLGIYRHRKLQTALQNWNIDEGYKADAQLDTYPRRVLGAGNKFALSVLLKVNKDDLNDICNPIPGFQVDYKVNHEIPGINCQISLTNSATFVLKPKMVTIAEELRSYSVTDRRCFFANERRLKYFRQYTVRNCEIECEVDMVLDNCGCYRINIENDNEVDICGSNDYNCYFYYINVLYQESYARCDCLPACSSISFESESSVAELNTTTLQRNERHDQYQYTELKFYFKEHQFMTSQRSELYGTTAFLANCGGLMGLCLGVSVISLFEIVYFCTIRLWFNFKRGNKTDDRGVFIVVEDFQSVRSRTPRILKITRKLVTDYAEKTTIQGIKYVAGDEISLGERIWWVVIFLASVVCCGSLIADIFRRYDQSPVIISYENEETSIDKIPFPAVTICPQFVSLMIPGMYDVLVVQKRPFYDLNRNDKDLVTAVAQVCDPAIFGDLDPDNHSNCENCSRNLREFLTDVDNILIDCGHIFAGLLCSQMFEEVTTDEGICYTYNALDVYRVGNATVVAGDELWTLEDGYLNSTEGLRVHPQPGSKYELNVVLKVYDVINEGLCKGPIQGFKVYLHLPNEAPQISKHYYMVPYRQSVEILVNPEVMRTAPELSDFAVGKRQCYFNDERYLRFFKYYTKNNCEIECLANLTLSKCGCLRFHMPETFGVKFCGIGEIKCYQQAIQQISEQNLNQSLVTDCNCLPACTSISFESEIVQYYFPKNYLEFFRLSPRTYKHIQDTNDYSLTKLIVSYKAQTFVALKRTQLYGKTELLANCGGLLGLFLGFSIVSILELVYFCTIRVLYNFFRMQ